jgi:hypothetical protein
MAKCPVCKGEKGTWVSQNSGPDRWQPCETCKETGEVKCEK